MLSLFNLPYYHFSNLLRSGVSLDQVYLLELVHNTVDITTITTEAKRTALLLPLVKKGYMDNQYRITQEGIDLLSGLHSKEPYQITRIDKSSDDFERWWNTYPSSNGYTIGNKTFESTRSLRKRKDVCAIKFRKILTEGKYTAEELIKALELEVSRKKQLSLSTGRNELSYMSGTEPYLNQGGYESFVEEIRKGNTVPKTQRNVIDI